MQKRSYKFMQEQKRADSRYFTAGEAHETLMAGKIWDPNAKRVEKPIYHFKTGATYEGQWKGGFRDGKGVQKWPDGASYEGDWLDNRAHG